MTLQQPGQLQGPNAGLLAPQPGAPTLLAGMTLAANSPTRAEVVLSWLKEAVAALIGLALVVCLLYMIRSAFGHLNAGATDPSFDRVKDLLLFINPLVGIVIGYYFNRVSTEARAENAERTARGATATALQAEAARGEAQSLAEKNKGDAVAARSALEQVIPAAETLLSQTASAPAAGVADAEDDGATFTEALSEARLNLRMALERARAVANP